MKTKYFCLTLLLAASGLPVFGQFNGYQYSVPKHDAPANVSPMATSQPLLGRWHASFNAHGKVCNQRSTAIHAQMTCTGQALTLLYGDERVTFGTTQSGEIGGRAFSLLQTSTASLWIWFEDGEIHSWNFTRPGDELFYQKQI